MKKSYLSELFHPFSTKDGLYCRFTYEEQRYVLPLQDEKVANYYKAIYRELKGKMIKRAEFELAMEELKLDAYLNKLEYSLEKVIFNDGTATYYNLNREDGKVICCENGRVEICEVEDVIFITDDSMKEQAMPNLKVKPGVLLKLLKRHFKLPEDEIILFALYLVTAFAGRKISHYMLILNGSKGSGKSHMARMIQDIVAPRDYGLTVIGKNRDDVAIRLDSDYLVVLDNLSTVKKDISDLLAVSVTGGTYAKRALYHNKKETRLTLHNMIVVTSIDIATNAPDVLDRSLIFTLPRLAPNEMKTQADLMEEFQKDLPKILGACLKIYAQADNDDRPVEVTQTRMADNFELMVKAGRFLGLDDEEVSELIWKNQSKVNKVTVEDNTAAMCLLQFMEDREDYCGSVASLWERLQQVAELNNIKKGFLPSRPNVLSRQLNQVKSNLEQEYGIFYEIKNSGPHHKITIQKKTVPNTKQSDEDSIDKKDCRYWR